MTQSISILEEVKRYLEKGRGKKHRIRTIYLRLRRLDRFIDWSDLVLLNSIVTGLIELGEPYSSREIYSVFKMVSKDDYDRKDKRCILRDLLRKATNKSVFKIVEISDKIMV